MDEITPDMTQLKTETTPEPTAAAPPRAALLRNIATVLLLFAIPVLGVAAIWTIAPWNRRGRIVVTAIFAPYAAFSLYRMGLVIYALSRAAFG